MKNTQRDSVPNSLDRLAKFIAIHAPYEGTFDLRVAGVHVTRSSRPYTQLRHATQTSSICIIARGSKTVLVGESTYHFEPGRIAIYSVDVPVAAQVSAAPYLNLKIDLDARKIAELALRVFPHGLPRVHDDGPVVIARADDALLDAAARLLELVSRPSDTELIAPLVIDEILIRLLRGPIGSRLAHIGEVDSGVNKIASAVASLRANFDQQVDVEKLAKLVNMSVSTFHRQFKAVTSMSPLQYQKALRLQEARRLMLTAMFDASEASRRVGYASASQFTREYGRFFGTPPAKDVQRLREQGVAEERIGEQHA